MEELKDKIKSVRPSTKLSKEASYSIKKQLKESDLGWSINQVVELL